MSAVLAGAVFGDHVSPISDTTIMASSGAQCNHIDHVKTQFPYASIVAIVSGVTYLIMGFVAAGEVGKDYGLSAVLTLVIGIVLMAAVIVALYFFNKKESSDNDIMPKKAFAGSAEARIEDTIQGGSEVSDEIEELGKLK